MSPDTTLPPTKTISLNYGALHEPLTGADVVNYQQTTGKYKPHGTVYRIGRTLGIQLGFSVLCMLIWLMTVYGNNDGSATVPPQDRSTFVRYGLIVWPMLVGITYLIVSRANRRDLRRRARLYKFASRSGVTYNHDFYPGDSTLGLVFHAGNATMYNDELVFPDGVSIGNMEYVTGSGKNETTHYWGVVTVPLGRELPQMVLDGKQNNILGLSNLPSTFDRSQKLSLEGDFDKYFTLYAPADRRQDALYIFTPDVMASLVDDGGGYDMEVAGTQLYIYKKGRFDLTSERQLSRLLTIAGQIGGEMRQQSTHYQIDDTPGAARLETSWWRRWIAASEPFWITILAVAIGLLIGMLSSG